MVIFRIVELVVPALAHNRPFVDRQEFEQVESWDTEFESEESL